MMPLTPRLPPRPPSSECLRRLSIGWLKNKGIHLAVYPFFYAGVVCAATIPVLYRCSPGLITRSAVI